MENNNFFLHISFIRRVLILPLFLISGTIFSQGQSVSPIDSIKTLLKTDQDDTLKLDHLYDLGWEVLYQNPDSSKLIANEALELGNRIVSGLLTQKDPVIMKAAKKGIANAYNLLGVYYSVKGDYSNSLLSHLKALEIREGLKDQLKIASSLNNLGAVFMQQGDYAKSLEYFLKALKIQLETGNKWGMASNLGNIGLVYLNQKDYPKALGYLFKALKLNEQLENKQGIAINQSNIANVYQYQGDYVRALEYYLKALKLNEELENNEGIAINLNNVGGVYDRQADFLRALYYYFKALEYNEKLSNQSGIALDLGNIGRIYFRQKKYADAEQYLLKALNNSVESGMLELVKSHNEELSKLYAETNRFELAYKHHVQFTIAKDSLFNDEKSKEIGRLETRHEIEIEEMERERIKNEEQKTKNQNRQRKHLLQYSGIVVLLLIIAMLITLLGFVKVGPPVARAVTFFSFLLFFEFLLVWLDPYIDRFSGGEPAYKLALNAAVAVLIFPLHGFFEKLIRKRLIK